MRAFSTRPGSLLLAVLCAASLTNVSFGMPNQDLLGPKHHDNHANSDRTDSSDFDYLIFRQIWPASSCMFPGDHTCSIARNISTWVVHGLWPTIPHEMKPDFCNNSLPFNPDLIKPLLPMLTMFWPNLYTNTPLDSFWKHEWEKHGTCTLSLPQFRSEADYFNVSLALRQKYDISSIFQSSSIVPDDEVKYSLDQLITAIVNVLNIQPSMVCYYVKEKNTQYLAQMQVCLDKKLQLIDCDSQKYGPKLGMALNNNKDAQEIECKPNVPIHYPTIKYQSVVKI